MALFDGWMVGLAASSVISVAFLAVAVLLGLNLRATKQWRRNPLGTGTFMLYLTCGGGHVAHTLQLLYPVLGIGAAAGAAARFEYSQWHMWLIDGVTAAVGMWYWAMRRSFPDLVSGAAVFEDLRERRRRALEIHDNVVQGLALAKLALDMRRESEGEDALRDSLEASKRIITDLLGEEPVRPGALRRAEPSAVDGGGPHGRA